MTYNDRLLPAIIQGWQDYIEALIKAVEGLEPDQLDLRASTDLRSVGEILAHMVGVRARWFHRLMGDGGAELEAFCEWGREDTTKRSAGEYVKALVSTWKRMHAIMEQWTEEDWEKTWPGKDEFDPVVITRQWVIWHLMEHDLHHGGEISLTLGSIGKGGIEL
jgi:uncharacterized damage-inducible protein DinB